MWCSVILTRMTLIPIGLVFNIENSYSFFDEFFSWKHFEAVVQNLGVRIEIFNGAQKERFQGPPRWFVLSSDPVLQIKNTPSHTHTHTYTQTHPQPQPHTSCILARSFTLCLQRSKSKSAPLQVTKICPRYPAAVSGQIGSSQRTSDIQNQRPRILTQGRIARPGLCGCIATGVQSVMNRCKTMLTRTFVPAQPHSCFALHVGGESCCFPL